MKVLVKQSVKNSNATTMPDILNEATWAFDKYSLPEEPTVEGRARMRS